MNQTIKKYLAEIGQAGGRAKSQRKTEACRRNAKKPRKRIKTLETFGSSD